MVVLATREIMTPVQLGLEELSDPVSVLEMVECADHDMLEGSDMALEQLVDGFHEPAKASINVRDQVAVDASFHDNDSVRDEIVVDGVTIRPDSALRDMQQACENLGGRSGGKVKVYKRLTEHLKRMTLLEQSQAAAAARQQHQRDAKEVSMVREPTY